MAAVALEAIAFNYDTESHDQDALNLRWNAHLPMIVPEWQRGMNSSHADSVAAYAIQETAGQRIKIKARFSTTQSNLRRARIRTVSVPMFSGYPWNLSTENPLLSALNPPLLNALIYLQAHTSARAHAQSQIMNVLGQASAREIDFKANGDSGFETFELPDADPGRFGIGKHLLTWWWQYCLEGETTWTTFALSQHTIYTVLTAPRDPWQQEGYPHNTQLPWVEVMDAASQWARGAIRIDRAAARITRAVYALGPELFEYNCPNLGAPVYTSLDFASEPNAFYCTAFLERLHGGFGRGPFVNCSDCASIVSTFANCVGCELWQSRMGGLPQGFSIHPILAIGSIAWAPPCGWWPGFGMHEVAWTGNCTDDDDVFDACLMFDADSNPALAPFTGILPTSVRFGRPGEGGYRDRLARSEWRKDCLAQPSTRQRRFVV